MKVKLNNVRRIAIISEHIRLDALLKYAAAVQTGGEAKAVIQDGGVYVDGEVCTQRGKKIHPGSVVRYGDEAYVVRGIDN